MYKLQIRSVIDYGLCIYYHNLKQSDIYRLNQIQYRAGKLVSGALHFTSCSKLFLELGWEELSCRAKFLGLTVFHKIHLNLTRPLVKACMPSLRINRHNTRTVISQIGSHKGQLPSQNRFSHIFLSSGHRSSKVSNVILI